MSNNPGAGSDKLIERLKKIRASLRIPNSVLLIFLVAISLFLFGVSQNLVRLTHMPQEIPVMETDRLIQGSEATHSTQPVVELPTQEALLNQPLTPTNITSNPTSTRAAASTADSQVTATEETEDQFIGEIVQLLDDLISDLEKTSQVQEAELP
jgi:hypothetical protein